MKKENKRDVSFERLWWGKTTVSDKVTVAVGGVGEGGGAGHLKVLNPPPKLLLPPGDRCQVTPPPKKRKKNLLLLL